MFSWLI